MSLNFNLCRVGEFGTRFAKLISLAPVGKDTPSRVLIEVREAPADVDIDLQICEGRTKSVFCGLLNWL